MTTPFAQKSTTEEIRTRFDNEVERFSNLETGQQATIDAPLVLELVAQASRGHLRAQDTILDLGCGAGNFTLRVLQETKGLHCHLADLSGRMLERAETRVRAGGAATVTAHQADLRALAFGAGTFDAILAGAVLHHLRDEADWAAAFARFHTWLKPGGRLYVADLVTFDIAGVQEIMWRRYGDFLAALGGA
jgi:tRNA (cmo5U34)-methyltransferase